MALNPSIILQGQSPNILAAMDAGQQAGARQNAIQQQNALSQAYKTDGAGILSGNTESLNRLAAIDAPLAMDFRTSQQNMTATQQRMNILDAQEQRAIQQQAATLSKAEREAEAARVEQGVAQAMAAQTPEQWDAVVGRYDPSLVGQFENREMVAARYMSIADVLKRQDDALDQGAPMTTIGKINADVAAGRITPEDAQLELERAAPRGMVIESLPGGGFRFTEKATAGGGREGGPADVTSAIAMINSIDGILNDPALENSTGIMAPLQAIPGTPMRRFGARADQLNGQAFLQAFESLKGGGQITEIEGQKATQAIGRLDTSQSAADYREALTELRSILSTVAARPEGWVEQQRAIIAGNDIIPVEIVTTMSPEQIRALGPAGLTRIPLGQLKGLSDEQWDALEALGSGQ